VRGDAAGTTAHAARTVANVRYEADGLAVGRSAEHNLIREKCVALLAA